MDEDETATEVIVGDVNAPDEIVNEGDNVVVVEAPPTEPVGNAVDAVVIATEIDQAERIARLEAEIATLRGEVYDAQLTAEVAQYTADDALRQDQEIVEAVDDAIVETIEGVEIEDVDGDGDDEIITDEIAPVSARVHPLFRSFKDWRGQ